MASLREKTRNSLGENRRYRALENWDKKPMTVQAELSMQQLNGSLSRNK